MLTAIKAQRARVADAGAVAFGQAFAVDVHAAARHVHIGMAVGADIERRGFAAMEQARVNPRILAYAQSALRAVGVDDETQAAALAGFVKTRLLIAGPSAGGRWS